MVHQQSWCWIPQRYDTLWLAVHRRYCCCWCRRVHCRLCHRRIFYGGKCRQFERSCFFRLLLTHITQASVLLIIPGSCCVHVCEIFREKSLTIILRQLFHIRERHLIWRHSPVGRHFVDMSKLGVVKKTEDKLYLAVPHRFKLSAREDLMPQLAKWARVSWKDSSFDSGRLER